MLTEFGGRISEKKPIWVQGESNDSEKRDRKSSKKSSNGKLRLKAQSSSEDTAK